MSNTDEFADQSENEAAPIQQNKHIELAPFYQQFIPNIVALMLTIIVMVGLTSVLFYQNNIQNSALVETQLIPLTQELKKVQSLNKAEKLIADLLIETNAESFVKLHAELITINRQLLEQNSSNGQLFQQWLNESKLAEDIVSRIQDSHTRNQQLKQSSIIQLQLMLVSISPIIDNKLSSQKALHKQLKADQASGRVNYSRANTYAKSVQQLNKLQHLKSLLADVLLGFEQLSMHTPVANFELLRLKVEQIFSQHRQLSRDGKIKAMVDVNQQFDAFEKIVLTEQRALAKWQGYIRLAQKYQLDLKAQQRDVKQLLLSPYKVTQASGKGIINELLSKLDIQLPPKIITATLLVAISISLMFFFYLLWRLREQIKTSAQQSVELIKNSLQAQEESVVANCVESQEIMNIVQSLAKPQHNENEFQELSEQYQSNQKILVQLKQNLEQLTKDNEQQQLDSKEKMAGYLNEQLLCYQLLEKTVLPIIQRHQVACFNQKTSCKNEGPSVSKQLTFLYQQLAQFHLALEMKLDKSVLKLSDINLVDEMHAILFNKQQEQQKYDNQLFMSCDEQLLREAKIDFRLFQQLISLFIDISLTNCKATQLHLQLQLQDKNTGQQLVRFSAKVKTQSTDTLPSLITQLTDTSSSDVATSPLIEVFNIMFDKQHGENIVAQLVDDGYQLNFELPLAIAKSTDDADKVILENTNVMLLSANTVLAELIENAVLSAKGKFEQLVRIDSFKQQVTAKHLHRRKLDFLVLSSDMASNHLDSVTKQINGLPQSLKPKLMILQSKELDYKHFGFYSQAENIFCKETFLHNIIQLLASKELNNQIIPCEHFVANQCAAIELPLLLAVKSPQQHQNLQRLLQWLGLQVLVVSHEGEQLARWKTGQYSLLITEFSGTALLEMTSKPMVNIGVLSLTDGIPHTESSYFENWFIGKLAKESTLAELIEALEPWLKKTQRVESAQSNATSDDHALKVKTDNSECLDEFVITEVAQVFTENSSYVGNEAAFDFSQYVQHQGTVELALFMLDDYTQENHQQLDTLIEAIKAKNSEEAKLSISILALNAKILSAQELQFLCVKWSKLLSGSEIPSHLKKVNALLKDTRIALNEIDEYAETI